jgi:hypothetical protein
MNSNFTSIEQGQSFQLIEIRKVKTDFASSNDYMVFRNELMSKAINPWLKDACHHKDIHEEKIPSGVWALIACEQETGAMNASMLLDFMELDFDNLPYASKNFDGIINFTEWVAHFSPKSWGDWLMVPKLFKLHLRSRENMPALAAAPDIWLNAVLRESRGILMWTYQLIQIIRMIADVGITEATKITTCVLMRNPGWEKLLETIYPPTKQSLLQIFEERTVGMQCLGSPDYLLADWLSNHFNSLTGPHHES